MDPVLTRPDESQVARDGWRLKKNDFFFFLIFAAALAFLFRDILFTSRIFFYRDSTVVEIPTRVMAARELRAGRFPLWTEAYGNGQPYFANPKHALLYPSTLLYLILPFAAAFKLHYLIHFLIGWAGVFLLIRSFRLSGAASFLGATIFVFSGVYLSCVEFYNHVAALAWMPWILLLLNGSRLRGWKPLAGLSLLWALMILAGTPFVAVITGISAAVMILLRSVLWKRKAGLILVSLILAVLLTAAQLLPSLEQLQISRRAERQTQAWSFEPLQMVNLGIADIFGIDRRPGHNDFWGGHLFDRQSPLFYSVYIGFGALFLALLGLGRPLDRRRLTWLILLGIFFLMALGTHTFLFGFWKKLPLLSSIRYPVKYLIGFILSISLLAAYGYDRLFGDFPPRTRRPLQMLALSIGIFGIFLILRKPLLGLLRDIFVITKEQSMADLGGALIRGLGGMVLFSLVIWLGARFRGRTARGIRYGVLALVMIDLIGANGGINPTVPSAYFSEPVLTRGWNKPLLLHRTDDLPDDLFWNDEETVTRNQYIRQSLVPFVGIPYDVRYLLCKDFYILYSVDQLRVMHFLKHALPRLKVKLLASLGCDLYISHHPLRHLPVDKVAAAGYTVSVQRIPDKLPRVRLVHNLVRADTLERRLEIFESKEFDPGTGAIVPGAFEGGGAGAVEDRISRVAEVRDRPGESEYRVESDRPGVLVMAGNYDPDWKAWVDGERTPVWPVDLVSRGVGVPAGDHRVRMRYAPASVSRGLGISLAGWVLFIGLLIFLGLRERRARGDIARRIFRD